MTVQADAGSKVFEQAMESFRKTAEITLSAQKELYQQWQRNCPASVQPQASWLDQVRQFQRSWANTVVDLVRKQRDTLDRQYQAGVDALEEAFSVADTSDPEELRKRAEQLCRKNLDCLKETSEAQIREFQNATTHWVELFTKGMSPEESAPEQ